MNAGSQSGQGPCRLKGAFVKRVPVILGRKDRNVGGRRQNVDDIDPPGPANLLPADSESDSGYLSLHILRYPYISMYLSDVFI